MMKMEEKKIEIIYPKIVIRRQTLLFSATALRAEIATKKSNKDKKWLDKIKIKGIGSGAVKSLPLHLQQLLSVVAVMGDTKVADVTGGKTLLGVSDAGEKKKEEKKEEKGKKNSKGGDNEVEKEEVWDGTGEGTSVQFIVLFIFLYIILRKFKRVKHKQIERERE